MIDTAERKGFGLAFAGHALLFAALSLDLSMRNTPMHLPQEAMDVELVGPVGLRSALPEPATEAPAESEAPEQGPSEDAVEPEPQPKPVAQPEPKPAPQPKPSERALPKPAPAKRDRLSSDFLKDLGATAAKEKKVTGKRLGADFLKGITAEKTGGKGAAPRAALTGPQMAGLAAAIAAQVRPCYVVPSGGTDASMIITILRLRFNRDGSTVGAPTVSDHQGIGPSNQTYVRQMDDAAKRAVLRCAPLKLPPDLYEGGWEDIEFVFNPRAMD